MTTNFNNSEELILEIAIADDEDPKRARYLRRELSCRHGIIFDDIKDEDDNGGD